jgi:uncharacterized protein YegJ (DUF2314 family)
MATISGFGRLRGYAGRASCAGLLFLGSCQHTGAGAAATTASAISGVSVQEPLSPLRSTAFRYRFGIYTSKTPTIDIAHALGDAVTPYGFKIVGQRVEPELPPITSTVFLTQPPIDKFAPPSSETMEFFAADLNPEERRRLSACQAVAVFEIVGPGRRAFAEYKKALKLGQDLARKLDGFLWDEETRTAHSVESWQRRLDSWQGAVPFINRHVAIHQYRDGELFRVVSLGMVKLGLPDIAVNQVAGKDADHMGVLVDLLLQRFVEGAVPDAQQQMNVSLDEVVHGKMKDWLAPQVDDNATRRVMLSVVAAHPEEGDSENRLLEVAFPGERARLQERQAATLATLFGSRDSVISLEHDAPLLAASERARKKAFALRERFAKGPPFGEQLMVKAPFPTADGGDEWMWVEVVTWQGNLIDGVLANDAFDIPTLKAGARVEVHADQIFDYILSRRDGTREGNETAPLIEARSRSRREKP